MKKRVTSGLMILGGILLLLFSSFYLLREVYDLFIVFLMLVSVHEISNAIGNKYPRPTSRYLYFSVVLSYLAFKSVNDLNFYFNGRNAGGLTAFIVSLLILIFISILISVFSQEKELGIGVTTLFCLLYPVTFLAYMIGMNYLPGESVGLLFTGGFYDPLATGSFIPNLRANAIILALVCSAIADMAAYFVGTLFKGPKLCPKISPKKTVSGAIGGIFGGVFGALLVCFVGSWTGLFGLTPIFEDTAANIWFYVGIGFVIACADELGDLIASYIKRICGVKDYGTIIPGHGGVLDRIDGLILASLATYFVMYVMAFLLGLL